MTEGPGRGATFTLHHGAARIGRGAGQEVRLEFGDTEIARDTHATVTYDRARRRFTLAHGGNRALLRLDGRPVLTEDELTSGALIRLGATTLRFVALCGEGFDWVPDGQGRADHGPHA